MINALFAVDYYGGMGNNGTLPWPHNSADLSRFKELTTNNIVVLGSKSWNDPKMPKPLSGRIVYVASSKPVKYAMRIEGNLVEQLVQLQQEYPDKEIFVVGGPDVLEQCRDVIDRIYLTYIKGTFKVDTKIDVRHYLSGFTPIGASTAPNINCSFVVYENLLKRT